MASSYETAVKLTLSIFSVVTVRHEFPSVVIPDTVMTAPDLDTEPNVAFALIVNPVKLL